MPRTLSHPHAPLIHKQFQSAVQDLNRRYANKITPAQMATLQASAGTNISPGAGLSTRGLAPSVQQPRGLTI